MHSRTTPASIEISFKIIYMHSISITSSLILLISPAISSQQSTDARPMVDSIEPRVSGVGGKIRLRGKNLGNSQQFAIAFPNWTFAEHVERHTNDEIVLHVPIGAEPGSLFMVRGAGSSEELHRSTPEELAAKLNSSDILELSANLTLLSVYDEPLRNSPPVLTEDELFRKDRIILHLRDFYGLDDAERIARQTGGTITAYVPASNTFALDVYTVPVDFRSLLELIESIRRDQAVFDASPEMLYDLARSHNNYSSLPFADNDVIDRYRHNYLQDLNGRADVWAYDRIQAPAAWNLIKRFSPQLSRVRIAVLDSGCFVEHAEFRGITLYSEPQKKHGKYELDPFNGKDADPKFGHGTVVCSIIGARDGSIINNNSFEDRGINGIVAGGHGDYEIFVYQTPWHIPKIPFMKMLTTIQKSAETGVRVINFSISQEKALQEGKITLRNIQVDLVGLAKVLKVFESTVLLCVGAGNQGLPTTPTKGKIEPLEDFNGSNRIDGGEVDLNGNKKADKGNALASLGTLPNVITVGAIGGKKEGSAYTRNDERLEDSSWGEHAAAPIGNGDLGTDLVVKLAAPGVEIFAARKPTGGGHKLMIGGEAYGWKDHNGTSFATPLVSGSAALLLSIMPGLKPVEVKGVLISTSLPVETTNTLNEKITWNSLKLGAAVRKLLLMRNKISDGQAWTGTSKAHDYNVASPPFEVIEFRQNPISRRSEKFRKTALPQNVSGIMIAASPRGDRIALHTWTTPGDLNTFGVCTLNLATEQLSLLQPDPGLLFVNTTGHGVFVGNKSQSTLEKLIHPWWPQQIICPPMLSPVAGLKIDGQVKAQFDVNVPAPFNTQDWGFVWLKESPDNRTLSLTSTVGLANKNAQCNTLDSLSRSDNILVNYDSTTGIAPTTLPLPTLPVWKYIIPNWSGDGRVFLATHINGAVLTHDAHRDHPDGTLLWSIPASSDVEVAVFAPDGSEILLLQSLTYLGHSLLRDGTNSMLLGNGYEDTWFDWTW